MQNIYNFESEGKPFLDVVRDDSGAPVVDPQNPDSYLTREIENTAGTILPSIGLMIEF